MTLKQALALYRNKVRPPITITLMDNRTITGYMQWDETTDSHLMVGCNQQLLGIDAKNIQLIVLSWLGNPYSFSQMPETDSSSHEHTAQEIIYYEHHAIPESRGNWTMQQVKPPLKSPEATVICSYCGAMVECSRSEEGGWDAYVGQYHHTCPECGIVAESELIHEGHVGCSTSDQPRICPLCHKDYGP